MKELFKSRQFWRMVALMVGSSFLIVIVTILLLRVFTRHGQSFEVPDFTGLSMDQLQPLSDEYEFEFVIIDSVFDDRRLPGTVVKHDPVPNSTVKRGRKFYITMASALPEMVVMPNLKDLSLRQATAKLESIGLSVGTITYKPDFSENAVLEQIYRGQPIISGETVRRGERIHLIVSKSE